MNPETTIKRWILACGKKFGIRQAHDYRWPDAESRQNEMYCTYQLMFSESAEEGTRDLTTRDGYDVDRKGAQEWITTVRIDMYNSQDGLYELAAFCVGAEHSPAIQSIFGGKCSYLNADPVENLSTWDDEEINYHQRLTCRFYETVELSLTEINAVVDSINISGAFTNIARENPIMSAAQGNTTSLGSATLTEA